MIRSGRGDYQFGMGGLTVQYRLGKAYGVEISVG